MKVKNKVISTVLGVIASSFVFIAAPISAHAGDCSAADPCQTYAVVDNSGNVINVIVCQPSVCGSGVLGDNRVVLQVASNPKTHDTTGTTGNMTNSVENKVVTLSNDNVFSVQKDNKIVQQIIVPEVKVNQTETSTTIIETSFSVGYGNINVVKVNDEYTTVNNPNFAIINATEVVSTELQAGNSTTDSVTITKENLTFSKKTTQKDFVDTVNSSTHYRIMQSRIDRLIKLLGDWFI